MSNIVSMHEFLKELHFMKQPLPIWMSCGSQWADIVEKKSSQPKYMYFNNIFADVLSMCMFDLCYKDVKYTQWWKLTYILHTVFTKVGFESRNELKNYYSLFLHTNHTNGFDN